MSSFLKKMFTQWFMPEAEHDEGGWLRRELALQNYQRIRVVAVFLAVIMAAFLIVDIFVINHYGNERIVDLMILVMADRLLIIGASIFFWLLTEKVADIEQLKDSQIKATNLYIIITYNCCTLISALLTPLKPGLGVLVMAIMVLTAFFRLPGKWSLAVYIPSALLAIAVTLLVQNNYMLAMADLMTAVMVSLVGLITMRILYCGSLRERFHMRQIEKHNRELARKNLMRTDHRSEAPEAYYIDSLTNIPNRLHFMEMLKKEWKRAAREKKPLSIVAVDIDQFSSLSARLGRKEAEGALQRVAAALLSSVYRPGDMVARFGDDEFVALLPDTGKDGARIVAERLKKAVALLSIAHPTAEGGILKIDTASITTDAGGEEKPEEAARLAFSLIWKQKEDEKARA